MQLLKRRGLADVVVSIAVGQCGEGQHLQRQQAGGAGVWRRGHWGRRLPQNSQILSTHSAEVLSRPIGLLGWQLPWHGFVYFWIRQAVLGDEQNRIRDGQSGHHCTSHCFIGKSGHALWRGSQGRGAVGGAGRGAAARRQQRRPKYSGAHAQVHSAAALADAPLEINHCTSPAMFYWDISPCM